MRKKASVVPGNTFAVIPDASSNKGKVFFKKPRRYCRVCKKGFTASKLNKFSIINKICGECEFNPTTHPEYWKDSIWFKPENDKICKKCGEHTNNEDEICNKCRLFNDIDEN